MAEGFLGKWGEVGQKGTNPRLAELVRALSVGRGVFLFLSLSLSAPLSTLSTNFLI